MRTTTSITASLVIALSLLGSQPYDAAAQDLLPETDDAVMGDYHTSPRYRESESRSEEHTSELQSH